MGSRIRMDDVPSHSSQPRRDKSLFNRQRMALNPAALEANRAGRITRGQRFQLSARATGAALGFVSTTLFAAIVWWLVVKGGTPWMAVPGLIATIVAPIALWAMYRTVADLRGGEVVSVTGQAVILREADSESKFRLLVAGRRCNVPITLADMLHGHASVTAFYTRWS